MELYLIAPATLLVIIIILFYMDYASKKDFRTQKKTLSNQEDELLALSKEMPFLKNYIGLNSIRIEQNKGYENFFSKLKVADIKRIPKYYQFNVLWDLIKYKTDRAGNQKILPHPYELFLIAIDNANLIISDGADDLYVGQGNCSGLVEIRSAFSEIGDMNGAKYFDKLIDFCKKYEDDIKNKTDNYFTHEFSFGELSQPNYDILNTVQDIVKSYSFNNTDALDNLN